MIAYIKKKMTESRLRCDKSAILSTSGDNAGPSAHSYLHNPPQQERALTFQRHQIPEFYPPTDSSNVICGTFATQPGSTGILQSSMSTGMQIERSGEGGVSPFMPSSLSGRNVLSVDENDAELDEDEGFFYFSFAVFA